VSEPRTLEDFPLHEGTPRDATLREAEPASESPAELPSPEGAPGAAASFAARVPAAAADAAMVLLMTALAVLAARLFTGASPDPRGLLWVAVFALYLSAFATIVPLVVFGRTVGMALADLTVRSSAGVPGVAPSAAVRRWLGTLATAASGGLLLLWTARNGQAPTPADRISGCVLIGD
jgi:RDD family